jgi:hypothetical protein
MPKIAKINTKVIYAYVNVNFRYLVILFNEIKVSAPVKHDPFGDKGPQLATKDIWRQSFTVATIATYEQFFQSRKLGPKSR